MEREDTTEESRDQNLCLALNPILGPPQFSLEKEVIKVPQGSNATRKSRRG